MKSLRIIWSFSKKARTSTIKKVLLLRNIFFRQRKFPETNWNNSSMVSTLNFSVTWSFISETLMHLSRTLESSGGPRPKPVVEPDSNEKKITHDNVLCIIHQPWKNAFAYNESPRKLMARALHTREKFRIPTVL